MQSFTIVNKTSLNKETVNDSKVVLENGSIVMTHLHKEDVLEIIQEGNNLIIKLKNGESIVIENFFVKDADGQVSDLVFDGTDCAFLLLDWGNGLSSFKELAGLEELLPIAGSGGSSLLPWIIGGGVAGGIGIAGGSNGSDHRHENSAPVAQDQILTTPEDQPVSGKVPATDVDGDQLTYTTTDGKNGTVTIDPVTGDYVYTPNKDYNGKDEFTVTIDDGKGGKTEITVDVTVTPVQDLSAVDDVATTDEDKAVTGDVSINDSTISGGDLTYSKTTDPQHGTLIFNEPYRVCRRLFYLS